MTRMNRFFVGSLAIGLGFATVAIAEDPKDAVKGAPVTLSGCVITDKQRSFVLTDVLEISGPTATTPNPTLAGMGLPSGGSKVIYWLSSESVKQMRGHLGHRVEVTGTITDVSTGTMRVTQEPGKPGPDNDNKVVIEARGKEASAETDKSVVPGPSPTTKTDETQTLPVRRVKVDTVKMIASTCQ